MLRALPRNGALGLRQKAFLMAFEKAPQDHDPNQSERQSSPAHGAGDAVNALPQRIGAKAEQTGPDDPARRIVQKEPQRRETIDPGEQSREGAQHGDEPTEENNRAAIAQKEILAELLLALVEPDLRSPPCQQPLAKRPPDPKAEIVSQDRASRRAGDDQTDIETMGRARVNGRADQDGFTGHWDTGALQHHQDEDGRISIGREKMCNRRGFDKMQVWPRWNGRLKDITFVARASTVTAS